MEKRIGKKITTPEDPLITAAIGAALIAAEK
jgi:activator of 2-hydroxyglutaryl-CoA dehydratase